MKYYENRIVAFIDVLGFSSLVSNINTDAEAFSNILQALSEFELTRRDFENERADLHDFPQGRACSLFSDSIVVSCLDTDENYATFLSQVAGICISVFPYGVLLRGGITNGELYHRRGRVFGRAMIDAYHLESRLAVYPRIIVEDQLASRMLAYRKDNALIRELLLQDSDGNWFIEYLQPLIETGGDTKGEGAESLGQLIKQLVDEAPKDQHTITKYRWLITHFNTVARRMKLAKRYHLTF